MRHTPLFRFLTLSLLLCLASFAQAATYYVATTGNDNNPGTQASPFLTIQRGINAAANGDTVQVAGGTYSVPSGMNGITWNDKSLNLQGAGSGNSIIVGSGNGRCMTLTGVPGSAVVAGFTIQNGNVGGVGGGMYLGSSSPTVVGCIIQNNQAYQGGGMFNDTGSNPTVVTCIFRNNAIPINSNLPGGGAMCNRRGSAPTVMSCIFSGNSDGSGNCGGMSNLGGSPTVTNCLFNNNSGSPMASTANALPTVTNCTFYGNGSYALYNLNGGVDNYRTGVRVTNCIFWGNGGGVYIDVPGNDTQGRRTVVSNSDVQGGIGYATDGGGNINADPQLAGDFRLNSTSPCINAGTASGAPATDLGGAPRTLGSAPDMGAYEYWSSTYGQWFVDIAQGNDTNPGSPTAPFKTVVKAINTATSGNKIYVKQGNYGTDRPRITKPLRLINWGNVGLARIGKP